METTSRREPFILIGMHRSGTSLVSEILDRLGVFVGCDLDDNHESLFFQRTNDLLLRQCGANWDAPANFDLLLGHPEARQYAVELARSKLYGPRVRRFLGWRRFVARRTPFGLSEPWGWKDPRNSVTLPVWQSIFPGAKVIHVKRHGVDAAASLVTRQNKMLSRQRAWLRRFALGSPLRGLYASLLPDRFVRLQGHTLDSALDLWADHVSRSQGHVRAAGARGLEFRYEDLLADPPKFVDLLVTFCGLDVRADRRDAAVGLVQGDRAFAFRGKKELVEFAARRRDVLARYGYADRS